MQQSVDVIVTNDMLFCNQKAGKPEFLLFKQRYNQNQKRQFAKLEKSRILLIT